LESNNTKPVIASNNEDIGKVDDTEEFGLL